MLTIVIIITAVIIIQQVADVSRDQLFAWCGMGGDATLIIRNVGQVWGQVALHGIRALIQRQAHVAHVAAIIHALLTFNPLLPLHLVQHLDDLPVDARALWQVLCSVGLFTSIIQVANRSPVRLLQVDVLRGRLEIGQRTVQASVNYLTQCDMPPRLAHHGLLNR